MNDPRLEVRKFLEAFGPTIGAKLYQQHISFEEAQRRFDSTLPYAARLAALPQWLTLHDIESAMGLSHSLFTHWSCNWMPQPEKRGNTLRWSKPTITRWINERCPRSDGTRQERLLESIETERQMARR